MNKACSQNNYRNHPIRIAIHLHNDQQKIHNSIPWELLYADDLVVIAETEDDLIKRPKEWEDNVKNRGMRVNMNTTKVTISGEWQKVMQKAAR